MLVWSDNRKKGEYLFGVKIFIGKAGHVLGQGVGGHTDFDCLEDYFVKGIDGMTGTELPGVAVHGECHFEM
jgi:hypothetical protein